MSGAVPVLATQAQRADAYAQYMERARSRSYIVGAHWFQYTDQPSTGRVDGENNNWGIVDIQDEEYLALAARMHEANAWSRP